MDKTPFVLLFQQWLVRTYGCTGGTVGLDNREEGAQRMQISLNAPTTHRSRCESLRYLLKVVQEHQDGRFDSISATSAGKLFEQIKENVSTMGTLLGPKLVHAMSILKLLPRDYLKHCPVGSKQHTKKLRERFPTITAQQATLVLEAIRRNKEYGPFTPSKADEIMCGGLKARDSQYADPILAGVSAIFLEPDPEDLDAIPLVMKLEPGKNKQASRYSGLEFNWDHSNDPLGQTEIYSTKINKYVTIVNLKKNHTNGQNGRRQTQLTDQQIASRQTNTPMCSEYDFSLQQVQSLLTKQCYIVMNDPVRFVSEIFGVLDQTSFNELLISSTKKVGGDDTGYLCTLPSKPNMKVILCGNDQWMNILDVPKKRRPVYDLKTDDEKSWSYNTRTGAVTAFLMHMLINMRNCQRGSLGGKVLDSQQNECKRVLITKLGLGRGRRCEILGCMYCELNGEIHWRAYDEREEDTGFTQPIFLADENIKFL